MIAPLIDQSKLITIERHIRDEQLTYPEATGALTSLLYDIALAGKVIASNTTRGGLVEVLNPSEAFLAERMVNAAGSSIAVTMEGTRPILPDCL